MSQVLEGSYYQVTSNGYVNKGKEVIKFASKVNHLPVHSKCNQLLKSESHPLNNQKLKTIEEVHCYFKSEQTKRPDSKFRLSLEKIGKSGENERVDSKNKNGQVQSQSNLTPRYRQQRVSNDSLQNPQQNESKSIHQQNREFPQQKIFSTNSNGGSKNSEIKNPLKQTISLMSLQKQQSKRSIKKFNLNTPKTAFHKNAKQGQKSVGTQSQDGDITEHAVYQASRMKRAIDYNYNRNNDKIICEISELLRKVGKMQERIQINEQIWLRNKKLEEIAEAEKELKNLQQLNMKLRGSQKGCGQGCVNIGNNSMYLFLTFLFGLIFARAVFC